jgi:hypothetical protein
MSQEVARTSSVANEMVGASVAAGAVAAVLTLGLADGIGCVVAWIGRQRLASDAGKHCCELEQFTREMSKCFERLAQDLDLHEPGLTLALSPGLDGLREHSMWFFEDNYRAFVLRARRARPEEIRNIIGGWVVEPLREALDATRRAAGRRIHQDRRSTDRSRLNECIRRTEYDLVAGASRLLHADVARPGERKCGGRKCISTLLLGILIVSVLPMRWPADLNSKGQPGVVYERRVGTASWAPHSNARRPMLLTPTHPRQQLQHYRGPTP